MTVWELKIRQKPNQAGFTIVELLIVIVVIAILASISIVSYNGIQQRARDSQRKSDISTITKAIELYYIDNGKFPPSSGSTVISNSWSTTADASWSTLKALLVPKYISSLPSDPTNTQGAAVFTGTSNYSYAYYTNKSTYCGSQMDQMYIIVYKLESGSQTNTLNGDCPTNSLGPYGSSSNYRVVR